MKRVLYAFIAAVVAIAFSSCNMIEGDPVTENFSIDGPYTELRVSDAFDITVSDEVDQAVITCGSNVMSRVIVETSGGKLRIYLKNWMAVSSAIKVQLPYNPALTDVVLSGASEFYSEFGLKGQSISVDVSGASDFEANMEAADEISLSASGSSSIKGVIAAKDMDVELSGASDAILEGEVGSLSIDLSGASNICKVIAGSQYALSCNECRGSISGSSHAYLQSNGNIKVSVSGSSSLHFTGTAFTGDCSTSGSSDLIHDKL